jgi:shikimate 5-dehydrogenase
VTAPGARSFVLLGNPVAHSVSPAIYAAAFAALKIHGTTVR